MARIAGRLALLLLGILLILAFPPPALAPTTTILVPPYQCYSGSSHWCRQNISKSDGDLYATVYPHVDHFDYDNLTANWYNDSLKDRKANLTIRMRCKKYKRTNPGGAGAYTVSDCTNKDYSTARVNVSNGSAYTDFPPLDLKDSEYRNYSFDLSEIKSATGLYTVKIINKEPSFDEDSWETIEVDSALMKVECPCPGGPCCKDCNYKSAYYTCGSASCQDDYFYISGSVCYKSDFPATCDRKCDGSGNCQNCSCSPSARYQSWTCGICQQRNLSSCAGSVPPQCENLLPGAACGARTCPQDFYNITGNECHRYDYPDQCTQSCDGSGNCQDCCNPSSSLEPWPSCGACQEPDYSSCAGSTGPLCRNSTYGTSCLDGICDGNGNCVPTPKPSLAVSAYLWPNAIKVGESAMLSGNVICQNGYCGDVWVYAKDNRTGLTNIPGLQSDGDNPSSCYGMGPGSSCEPGWNLTALSAGRYEIYIHATNYSLTNFSSAVALDVTEIQPGLGALSVSVRADPSAVNLSKTTTVYANVSCSESYCGSVSASIAADPGISLASPSQQQCNPLPCSLAWTLSGISEGTHKVNVTALSNESLQASSSTTVAVIGPNPQLSLEISAPESIVAGQGLAVAAEVTCYSKDCGQTAVTLSYRMKDSDAWNALQTYIEYLAADDSVMEEWEANLTTPGLYEIMVSANGSSPGTINGVEKAAVNVAAAPPGKAVIEKLFPKGGETFFMGENVTLRIRITRDGKPAEGLSPSAKLMGLAVKLQHSGSGIYEGAASVPSLGISKRTPYTVVFTAEDSESSADVYVDPTLQTAVRTDKDLYEWGEEIEISGETLRKGMSIPSNVTIKLTCGEWDGQVNLGNAGRFSYLYENRFMPPESDCALMIRLIANDSYGNRGFNYTEVSAKPYKGELYSVSFIMEKYNYSREETVPVYVEVGYMGSPKTGASVVCSLLGEEIRLEEKSSGRYGGSYAVPVIAPLGGQSLSCSVKAERSGSGSVKIRIEPMPLTISVISPDTIANNVIYLSPGSRTILVVKLKYPDNSPVTSAIMQAASLDQKVNMTHVGNGTYISQEMLFQSPAGGVTTLVLQAEDPMGNYGKDSITLVIGESGFSWLWLLLIPAGVALLLVGWGLRSRSREPPRIQIQEKIIRIPVQERVREIIYRPIRVAYRQRAEPAPKQKSEVARLEEKYKTIQSAKDLAEQQYYKRQIDEPTFNKLMQSYEEKLIELDAAMKQKRKEELDGSG